MHEEVFAETDCLQCARCCRATGPLLTKKDIQRIAKKQGIKTAVFEEKYLRVDEDGDWVMKSLPCPFLALDTNKCTIYEYAPKACRQYPHTDHSNMKSILGLTETNVMHCPAVFEMVERMKANQQLIALYKCDSCQYYQVHHCCTNPHSHGLHFEPNSENLSKRA